MFNKANEGSSPVSQVPSGAGRDAGKNPGMPSIISPDLKIIGDLQCAGDIQIEGTVEGDIRSQTVTVGEGAMVSGSMHADTVRVSGSVKGQIEATAITLAKTAKINGDLIHETLSIEAGAYLEGHCRRIEPEQRSSGRSKVSGLKTAREQVTPISASASAAAAVSAADAE